MSASSKRKGSVEEVISKYCDCCKKNVFVREGETESHFAHHRAKCQSTYHISQVGETTSSNKRFCVGLTSLVHDHNDDQADTMNVGWDAYFIIRL